MKNALSHTHVLVTGGAGFIGSRAAAALCEQNARVTVLDSFITGRREHLAHLSGVSIVEGDIRDTALLDTLVGNATHVIHCAALASVPKSMEDPRETHDVNVTGTLHVLEAARRAKVTRVIYTSSAAVYGITPSFPARENSPLAPASPYALSKMMNESYARFYTNTFGLETLGLRLFNVYGLGQNAENPYASIIPRWLGALRKNEKPILYGDGSQTRDFIEVRDVARAFVSAVTADIPIGAVINVGSGIETSLIALWAIIKEISGATENIEMRPPRLGDIERSVAGISLAHEFLGFSPTIPLSDGLKNLLS